MTYSRPVTEFKQTKLHVLSATLVKPIIKRLVRIGVDPNLFTILGVVMAVATGAFIIMGWWWQALTGLFLNGLCDILDGELARSMSERSHKLNRLGVFLDPATDRVNDALFFLGLLGYLLWKAYQYVLARGLPDAWVVFFFIAFCLAVTSAAVAHPISSFYRAKIESMNMRFQDDKPLTRAGFQLSLGVVCFGMWVIPYSYEDWFFVAGVLVLVVIPTLYKWFRRLRHSMKLFEQLN